MQTDLDVIKYLREGSDAFKSGLVPEDCPYGVAEIKARCAWLAGYWDRAGEELWKS